MVGWLVDGFDFCLFVCLSLSLCLFVWPRESHVQTAVAIIQRIAQLKDTHTIIHIQTQTYI